jgi:hypothetical protein
MQKPRSVTQAVIAIWVTIALDVLVLTIEGSTGAMATDVLLLNSASSVFYGLIANRISAGNNFARHVYAILAAVEVAALFAFGLDSATELETASACISPPIEAWVMFMLFRAESTPWFVKPAASGRK